MAGLVPGIHVFFRFAKTWMPGTRNVVGPAKSKILLNIQLLNRLTSQC